MAGDQVGHHRRLFGYMAEEASVEDGTRLLKPHRPLRDFVDPDADERGYASGQLEVVEARAVEDDQGVLAILATGRRTSDGVRDRGTRRDEDGEAPRPDTVERYEC